MADNLTNQAEKLSDEELQAHLDKLDAFYADQLPRLRVTHEYEKLKCETEQFRLNGMLAKLRMADLLKPAPNEDASTPTSDGSGGN
jgi:hypothetical protein